MGLRGRKRVKPAGDRFDAMSEGYLVAEALGYFGFDRYDEFLSWYSRMPDVDAIRTWVRANKGE